MAIGRTFAAMKDYKIDGNTEMVALGTMNIVGSLTSCYVATGMTLMRISFELIIEIFDFSCKCLAT